MAEIVYRNPSTVAAPAGRYTHAVVAGGGDTRFAFVSGQVAINASGKFVGEGDVRAQTEQVFKNLTAILADLGGSLRDVVKSTVFVTDIDTRGAVAEVRARYFADPAPASSFVEVSKLADPRWLVEIEVIAAVKG